MKTKKEILKKYTGRGGPLSDIRQGIGRGMLNIGNNTIKGAKSAYTNNMAQYKKESGIDKTDPIDNVKAGIKGLMGGALGAVRGMRQNFKSNVDKVRSILSPKKAILKKQIGKKIPLNAIKSMPLNSIPKIPKPKVNNY